MDIILPLAIGLAVACAVFVLGRVFVGSGSTPDKLSTFAGAKIVDEAKAARAVSLGVQRNGPSRGEGLRPS
jgi:hypothetical protein